MNLIYVILMYIVLLVSTTREAYSPRKRSRASARSVHIPRWLDRVVFFATSYSKERTLPTLVFNLFYEIGIIAMIVVLILSKANILMVPETLLSLCFAALLFIFITFVSGFMICFGSRLSLEPMITSNLARQGGVVCIAISFAIFLWISKIVRIAIYNGVI